jgi:mannose-6-phosphate isomerase-like protein (cupin superfamily)
VLRFPDFVAGETSPARVAFRCHPESVLCPWHRYDVDEYVLVVEGEYVLQVDDGEVVLRPGNEVVVPAGTRQMTRAAAGTRTIHAFGRDVARPSGA